MQIEDQFSVAAPIEEVWRVLSNPIELAECFPGVEDVTRLDEVRTRARLRVKISYVSATFDIEGEIFESNPPHALKSRVQGKDGRLGSTVIGETSLRLTPGANSGETQVHYAGDLTVTGTVASFGRPFIERKAKKDLRQFVENVQKRFAPADTATEAP